MKDGHPYETEEMDILRAEQRLLLRNLPDEVVEPLSGLSCPGDVAGADRLERLVRERARIAAANADAVSLLAELQPVQELKDLYGTLYNGLAEQAGPDTRTRLAPTINAIEKELNEVRGNQKDLMAHELFLKFSELAGLLCWADTLASDGYRDPRVPPPAAFVVDVD